MNSMIIKETLSVEDFQNIKNNRELLAKIKEFTIDGPPGVGQLIELGDFARKACVTKSELENTINDRAVF